MARQAPPITMAEIGDTEVAIVADVMVVGVEIIVAERSRPCQ